MTSEPHRTTHAPRPMRKNPWLALLAGAATIVVVAGNIACEPTLLDEPKGLGALSTDVKWTGQENATMTWGDLLGQ